MQSKCNATFALASYWKNKHLQTSDHSLTGSIIMGFSVSRKGMCTCIKVQVNYVKVSSTNFLRYTLYMIF